MARPTRTRIWVRMNEVKIVLNPKDIVFHDVSTDKLWASVHTNEFDWSVATIIQNYH